MSNITSKRADKQTSDEQKNKKEDIWKYSKLFGLKRLTLTFAHSWIRPYS